jgi:hypothetical protein
MNPLRLHLIACQVFQREIEVIAAEVPTALTVHSLEIGLHDGPAEPLCAALQAAIDAVHTSNCDAIGVAYGLCNRGILGLQARALPVVIPQFHDCIGMLMGDTDRYLAELQAHPGTYFQSAGWIEHLPADRLIREQSIPLANGMRMTRDELVARYGQDNADYLLEQYTNAQNQYVRLAYIATPVPQSEDREERAAEIAKKKGWTFARVQGDIGMLRRMLSGDWNDTEFLNLQPGQRVVARYDGRLIGAEGP